MLELKDLTDFDRDLIEAAKREFGKQTTHDWHGVACAIRLKSGQVITSLVLEAENPSLTICAEPIAIGKAINDIVDDQIEVIVAVRARETSDHKVIPPCGRCREFITDYAIGADVIVYDNETQTLVKVSAPSLLPFKYKRAS